MDKRTVNPYHLILLKALISFKEKGDFKSTLTINDRIKIGKEAGISDRTLDRIFGKGNDARISFSNTTLDLLCSWLEKGKSWNDFVKSQSVPTEQLASSVKKSYLKSINDLLSQYENFEKYILKQPKLNHNISENIINTELLEFSKRLYIELITRKAAIAFDEDNDVVVEIYDSWYKLFCFIRDELKGLPIESFKNNSDFKTPVNIALEILNGILRPHLTQHQAKYRNWIKSKEQSTNRKANTPHELQRAYPDYAELIKSIQKVNQRLVDSSKVLYDFCSQALLAFLILNLI